MFKKKKELVASKDVVSKCICDDKMLKNRRERGIGNGGQKSAVDGSQHTLALLSHGMRAWMV